MNKVFETIGDFGIIPVFVSIEDPNDAVSLCSALAEGGLSLAEITLRSPGAEQAIKNVAEGLPDFLVGAGTVRSVEQAERAIKAGAKFIVTPAFNKEVIQYCISAGVPVTPGCCTPTEVQAAADCGLEVVKFFPAEISGGIEALKAIADTQPDIKFMPTNGIEYSNIQSYVMCDKVLACGVVWMVTPELVKSRNYEEITRLTKEAVLKMLGFDLIHLGINTSGPEEALGVTRRISHFFGFPVKEGNSSNFAGTQFEVMKSKGLGTLGHVAIVTNSIYRAISYLERLGFEPDWSSAKGPEGAIIAVYFKEEIGGFAFHLLQKKQ